MVVGAHPAITLRVTHDEARTILKDSSQNQNIYILHQKYVYRNGVSAVDITIRFQEHIDFTYYTLTYYDSIVKETNETS